jgi:hypothetical protein
MVGLMTVQILIGVWHHSNFKRTKTRTWRHTLHVWYGRILIIMGVIDGGLGYKLAANASRAELDSYIVIVVLSFVTYVGVIVADLLRKKPEEKMETDSPVPEQTVQYQRKGGEA